MADVAAGVGLRIRHDVLAQARTRAIALARAMTRAQGLRIRSGSTETFLSRLAATDLSPSLNDTLVPLRRLIEILDAELATADTRLHELVTTDVTVRRLTT